MKTFFWLLFFCFSASAATINIGPGDTVNWGSVQPGDVIQLAAGNYSGGFSVQKSGTADKPITIKGPASGTAKWTNGWDIGPSNYVTIDGDHAYGIKIDLSGGSGGDGMRWGDKANVTGLTLKNVELIGTPKTSGVTSGNYGLNFCPYDFKRENFLIDHCRVYQWCESFRANHWNNAVIQNSIIQKTFTDNVDHADIVYFYPSTNVTFRWNSISETPEDGIFFEFGGAQNFEFYGNWIWNSTNHFIFYKQPGPFGPVKIFNNTFVGKGLDQWQYGYISSNGGQMAAGSIVKNNIFFNTENNLAGTASNNNAYNYTTLNGYPWPNDPGSFTFTGDPFIDKAGGNVRLNSNGIGLMKGKGVVVTGKPEYALDADGNARGSGAWDIGAFIAGGSSPGPTATPSATPAPSPTATPAPTPTPAAKFKAGDAVTPTAVVNVRATPSGTILGTHKPGDIGAIVSGPISEPLKQDVNWYDITWSSGPKSGWSGDDDLTKTAAVATPTPTPAPTSTPAPTPTPPTGGGPTYTKWADEFNKAQADWVKAHPPQPD